MKFSNDVEKYEIEVSISFGYLNFIILTNNLIIGQNNPFFTVIIIWNEFM